MKNPLPPLVTEGGGDLPGGLNPYSGIIPHRQLIERGGVHRQFELLMLGLLSESHGKLKRAVSKSICHIFHHIC